MYIILYTHTHTGLCYCLWAFSGCSEQGLLSSSRVRASHLSDFCCCRPCAPGGKGSVVVTHIPMASVIFLDHQLNPMFPALAHGFLTSGPWGTSSVLS